ncbi:MAG: IS66 family transposase [Chloroflexi bacterium]|nr:IS66 family transposase [Chloroflexota bacterium]
MSSAAAALAAGAAEMVHVVAVNRPTREALLASYRAGPAAMLALVEALLDRIAALEAANVVLSARVPAPEDRLALDRHHRSTPPSSDLGRPKPAPRSRRPAPGETGRAQCGACGQALDVAAPGAAAGERLDAERRQVVDLPPLALEVTEHRVAHVTCPTCGAETAGVFPAGVTQPVPYGDRLKAEAVSLHDDQLLPYARTTELLDDLFGAGPGARTVAAAEVAGCAALAPVETAIKAALAAAAVAGCDETSVRVNGHRAWRHVADTATLTHDAVPRLGCTDATKTIGILPAFTGTAEHDAYASYLTYTGCAHALGHAHLLRELLFRHEPHHQAGADELATRLVTAQDLVDTARAARHDHLDEVTLATLAAHYDHLLEQGRAANPPQAPPPDAPPPRGRKKQRKAQHLLDRLTTHRQAVWAFAHDCRVPFDHNQAERDLRLLQVQQKISGGFRSPAGATRCARLRGYIATIRKQGLPVLATLEQVFTGTPLVPNLSG